MTGRDHVNPPDIERVQAEKARRSLRDFVKYGWHVVEPHIPYVQNWHIEAIAEHLEAVTNGEIKKLVINVPPGHMKSLMVCVFWPSWEWIRTPYTRWLFASYSSDLSVRDSNRMRVMLKSDWYVNNFGITLTKDHEKRLENSETGFRVASSTGGLGTGERVHRAVSDDLLRANDAHSSAMRMQAIGHMQAMSTRGINPDDFAQVLIMQRLHEDDPTGWALSNDSTWEHLCLPAEYEPARKCRTSIGFEDPRTEPGELLWPEQFPADSICSIKSALGSYGASGQLQQNPSPAEGGIIKRAWWRYISADVSAATRYIRIVQSWDTGFKTDADNDESACTTWGDTGQEYHLLHCWAGRLEYPDLKRKVIELALTYRPHALLVEDKASGQSLIQELKRGTRLPVLAIGVDNNKIARAHAVTPQVEAGRVCIVEGEWNGDFTEECAMFPKGKQDNRVDSMTQALNWMSGTQPMDFAGFTIPTL